MVGGAVWPDLRKLSQRLYFPSSRAPLDCEPAFQLPVLSSSDRLVRQHSSAELLPFADTLPSLRRKNLVAISGRRARDCPALLQCCSRVRAHSGDIQMAGLRLFNAD